MKIVICKIGKYFLPKNLMDTLEVDDDEAFEDDRTNELLVKEVESIIEEGGKCCLKVVDLPDDITDWEIERYDAPGCHMERIIYVRDGKIHRTY